MGRHDVPQDRDLDGAGLGLGEEAPSGALAAATARAGELSATDRTVLGHYCRMERELSWPDDAFFTETARVQARLIGSARFRELAAKALGTEPPRAAQNS